MVPYNSKRFKFRDAGTMRGKGGKPSWKNTCALTHTPWVIKNKFLLSIHTLISELSVIVSSLCTLIYIGCTFSVVYDRFINKLRYNPSYWKGIFAVLALLIKGKMGQRPLPPLVPRSLILIIFRCTWRECQAGQYDSWKGRLQREVSLELTLGSRTYWIRSIW